MFGIGRFLMEKSIFAVVPVLFVLFWYLAPAQTQQVESDPWGRHRPEAGTQLSRMIATVGEHFGVGTAKAAGDGEAALAFRKARIAGVYARSGYRKQVAAARLGMSQARFEATLREYGIVEWPEGHKGI